MNIISQGTLIAKSFTDARVAFETAVGKLSQKPETVSKAKPLYAFFHDFEARYGELAQIVKLEKRMSETFPDDPRLSSFSQRFTHEGFDPTAIRPFISPDIQARPKSITSIEPVPAAQDSPPSRSIQITNNSPKRPLPKEESDNESSRPRKVARGESPLKGAAGQRILDQQKRNRQPQDRSHFDGQSTTHLMPPTPLPREIGFLLSIIPKPSTYHATKFNPEAMVKLIRDTHIPTSYSQIRPVPNGAGMQQIAPMPPGQYPGRYPTFPHNADFPIRPRSSFVEVRVRGHEDMTRSKRRSKPPPSAAKHKKPTSKTPTNPTPPRVYKDFEVLGLCRSHDTASRDSGLRALKPPLPHALRRSNLLSTMSANDLNAWMADYRSR